MRTLRLLKVNSVPAVPSADCLYLLKDSNLGLNAVLYTRSKARYAKAMRDVLLTGPKTIYQSVAGQATQATYTIANFDSFTTYNVSVSAGSVSINGATITVTSPTTAGKLYLTINGETSIIQVLPPSVKAPSVTYPTPSLSTLATSFTATFSAFAVSSGSDTMQSLEWQACLDSTFGVLTTSGTVNGAVTTATISGLTAGTTYYLRARHKGNSLGYSQWSDPVKFSTKLAAVGTTEVAKLQSSAVQLNEQFGTAVSLSGDGLWAACGAPNGKSSGVAYGYVDLFHYEGGTWVRKTRCWASDPTSGQLFGQAVELSYDGSVLVVGAPQAAAGAVNQAGAVYVFTRSGSTWTQAQKLVASSPVTNEGFGSAVALSNLAEYVMVGVPNRLNGSYTGCGAVDVFVKGTTWDYQATLSATEAQTAAAQGTSVKTNSDGSVVIYGAPGGVASNLAAGAAMVYTRSGTSWTKQTVLTPNPSQSNMKFGTSVALSNDGLWAAVGAPNYAPMGIITGGVQLFKRITGSWTASADLYAESYGSIQAFGTDVVLNQDGTQLLIGDPSNATSYGAGFVYSRNGLDWSYVEKITKTAQATNDNFGYSVAMDMLGKRYLVGAYKSAEVAAGGGSAYLFQ